MSRCYPYPPPGYVKKANGELAFSTKKEKHKHKDKKKKRRKDSETNGDLPRDLDRWFKKSHQIGVGSKEEPTLENGRLPEPNFAESYDRSGQKLQANTVNAKLPSLDVGPDRNGIRHAVNRQAEHVINLFSTKDACESNDILWSEATVPLNRGVKLREDHIQIIPPDEQGWSALDDQEWLAYRKNYHHLAPKKGLADNSTLHVWEEVVLLPSVGIYALPYVVPH
ncbi:hypothetical protein KP509_26G055100 [Ceratopteris richardii]|uniref:Uncharacterized protein n=1 Tax=Ceratopteris richardii TaxID=49495 RepID=A0A8T2RMD8_CERRI|nr:hypothetical protein KP509_26G055100 [Ceratopteris richardii]